LSGRTIHLQLLNGEDIATRNGHFKSAHSKYTKHMLCYLSDVRLVKRYDLVKSI